MPQSPLVLALDQSTSATKAMFFDASGSQLDKESREHKQHYPAPGWVEHDAEEIWSNTLEVLRTLTARNPALLERTLCLSLTNQRETIVVFDRATGRPLHNAIVWQCRRGDAFCRQFEEEGRGPWLQDRTGLRLDAYFSGSKLLWLSRNNPALRAKLESGEALIGTIDAYLIYRLTEGRVFATDSTNASRTLLFDIGRLAWDEELCRLWEVPLKALPEVRESSAFFGETTLGGVLPAPLRLCGVMGDSQASLFAQRCFAPGSAKVTFGTGSSVLLNIGPKPRFSRKGLITALAWVQGGEPTYAFEGIIICSAGTLGWIKDQLGLVRDYREIDQLAESLSSNDGVYLVPAFSGLGLPHWQPEARAAIVGLSGQSDRRHLARAALESIAYQVHDALWAMREEAGVPLASIHGDGGTTVSRFLMQFIADLTRVELQVASMSDCSPLGAALCGLLGCGHFQSAQDIAALPRWDAKYLPLLDSASVAALTQGWQKAVRRVL